MNASENCGIMARELPTMLEPFLGLSDIMLELQEEIARGESSIMTEAELRDEKRRLVKQRINQVWTFNNALIRLIVEILRIAYYLFEITIVLYALLVVIPRLFVKLQKGIVNSYIKTRGR